MHLDRYVEELHGQLMVAADAWGDDARALAERLAAPLDAAVRLVLLEALADASAEMTLELAPGSVEVRLRGREPEIVFIPAPVDVPSPPQIPHDVMPTPPPSDTDDSGTARLTLRMPESLKQRVEDAAGRQQVSVNSWLVRAVSAAVDQRGEPSPRPSAAPSVGSRFTGWAR